jgi:DNA-nicking Smr family endonuclease
MNPAEHEPQEPRHDEPEPFVVPIEDSIDLHTFHPREIKILVPEYLEQCRNRGLLEVRIIHGRGSGTLRRTVRALLQRLPFVESFQDAPPERGGWGATIARLTPGIDTNGSD